MAAKTITKAEKITETVEPEAPKAEKAPKFAATDTSIDARMWRLLQDHIAMGSRRPE